jgi:hypothetical protein
MPGPISCNPTSLPVRPENLDPDWIVTLAANLAQVEDRCEPVAAPGPSYEEVRRAQHGAVGEPVETLVRRFDRASANDWFAAVQNLAGVTKRGVGQAVRLERVVEAILSNAVEEGQELKQARVRDAKVAAVLSLGESALDTNFLSAELRERSRSLGEAALVLARIDAVPGLRAALSAEIRRAIQEGRALVASEALCSQAGLDAFIATATALGERAERGEALTPRERFVLDSVNRSRTDTAFRIGMEEALSRGQRSR